MCCTVRLAPAPVRPQLAATVANHVQSLARAPSVPLQFDQARRDCLRSSLQFAIALPAPPRARPSTATTCSASRSFSVLALLLLGGRALQLACSFVRSADHFRQPSTGCAPAPAWRRRRRSSRSATRAMTSLAACAASSRAWRNSAKCSCAASSRASSCSRCAPRAAPARSLRPAMNSSRLGARRPRGAIRARIP